MMVKHSDFVICDSINIEKYIHECYDGRGIKKGNPKDNLYCIWSRNKKEYVG